MRQENLDRKKSTRHPHNIKQTLRQAHARALERIHIQHTHTRRTQCTGTSRHGTSN